MTQEVNLVLFQLLRNRPIYSLNALAELSSSFLAPGTGFRENSFSTDDGGRCWNDSHKEPAA